MNLSVFNTQNLYDATHELFARLRIKLNSKTAMSLPAKTLLADNYLASFDKQDFPEIQELYFAGIVDDSIFEADAFNNGYTIDDANDIDKNTKNYPGFMIFALLLDKHPTRTQIANLSRAFNRKWNVPVALLIQYGRLISLALPERFKYLQNWRQGEKVGKVIILRDINTDRPHTGHLRILQDLSKHNATNFNELHEKWLKVLNIKTLNDEFYERLVAKVNKSSGAMIEKGWYFKCFEDIRIDLSKASLILNKKIEDELKPQAVIRVIIRLMFIWFMKEKELINPDFFTRDFMNDFLKRENTYYNAVLQNLFFAVLNAKISERRFRKQNKNSYFDTEENEYGMFQLFRYESFFKQGKAEEFKQLTDTIPFVNGGLFTCHDQKIKHNQSENYIIDGFSDNPNHRTVISDSVIFELIDLFNDYVFTIEESTPMEQDIALDPELLGTIFENLIGFYNPETKE
ncbi:MAG: hypothetical protein LBE91_21140, partial [Tannerella sp.]|nr:hypothetical protein [Tannerella sp.]